MNLTTFPSCSKPLFQIEAKCKANDIKMIIYSHANKTHLHKKGFLHLVLFWKWKFWKWPIVMLPKAHRTDDRAIFVWPWNENARTKQKRQKNGNRAIWLVYRTDTNARGFWLVKRTLGWKNFLPEKFLEINWYFALTSYCKTIGQSNNAFSILGFSLAGKRRVYVLIFSSIGW